MPEIDPFQQAGETDPMPLVRELKAALAAAPKSSLLDSSIDDWRHTVNEQLTEALAKLGDPDTIQAKLAAVQARDKPEEQRTNWSGWLDLDKLLNKADN